ncbi:MAG: trehalose 6-phosphatase [Rhizobacter sp.]|nr:trehalose 6-phosphatase [Rhizobacter sp.]
MLSIPYPGPQTALFLDFDGTLAELAEQPDLVLVQPELVPILSRLSRSLDGAVAIVTGRTIVEIDAFLAPLVLPVAGVHGAERRTTNAGDDWRIQVDGIAQVAAVAHALQAKHEALIVEQKSVAVALHYRQAPDLEAVCLQTMSDAAAEWPDLIVLRGKKVVEVKPRQASKGAAVRHFLGEQPFVGRIPWFVGDDVTDEAAFEVVNALNGFAIKIGAGDTGALYRLQGPAELREWLALLADELENKSAGPRSA